MKFHKIEEAKDEAKKYKGKEFHRLSSNGELLQRVIEQEVRLRSMKKVAQAALLLEEVAIIVPEVAEVRSKLNTILRMFLSERPPSNGRNIKDRLPELDEVKTVEDPYGNPER